MIYELLSNEGLETNHFIRMSNSVIFLEFIEEQNKTGFTIIKKNSHSSLSTAEIYFQLLIKLLKFFILTQSGIIMTFLIYK